MVDRWRMHAPIWPSKSWGRRVPGARPRRRFGRGGRVQAWHVGGQRIGAGAIIKAARRAIQGAAVSSGMRKGSRDGRRVRSHRVSTAEMAVCQTPFHCFVPLRLARERVSLHLRSACRDCAMHGRARPIKYCVGDV